MTRYTIQETYEYYVEADSPDQAQEIFEAYQGDGDEHDDVTFTQNYTHMFDNEGKEV
jgi:hypothetical protein